MAEMVGGQSGILERLAVEALKVGADTLEIEYKDGWEEIVAFTGDTGHGLARLRSSSPEAVELRDALYGITKRKRRVTIEGSQYELRAGIYENFGDDAFRVQLQRV